jgi:mannose-6-phosphate isomerase-like protein (cupin superfamily)
MAVHDEDRPAQGMLKRPTRAVNLTAATGRLSWEQACKMIGVIGPAETIALEVLGIAESGGLNDGSRETVYFVVSGFGLLCSEHIETECTVGDVLFVPKGCPHHFQSLDGDIKIWRVSPVAS